MNYPKVLVCAPTNKVKDYCQWRWIEQVLKLDYPNFSVFVSDNTKSDDFANEMRLYNIDVGRVNPDGKSNQEYMAESHEQCRKKAIEIGADYILHWEVDLFTDNIFIINDLMQHDLPVVGGIYHIGQGKGSYLCLAKLHEFGGDSGISVFPMTMGSDLMVIDGGLKKVFSCGLGCVLIHKSVFTKINFRHENGSSYHPDSSFSEDCFYQKIPIFADTSTFLKHENARWLLY